MQVYFTTFIKKVTNRLTVSKLIILIFTYLVSGKHSYVVVFVNIGLYIINESDIN